MNCHLSIFRWINFYTFESLGVWVGSSNRYNSFKIALDTALATSKSLLATNLLPIAVPLGVDLNFAGSERRKHVSLSINLIDFKIYYETWNFIKYTIHWQKSDRFHTIKWYNLGYVIASWTMWSSRSTKWYLLCFCFFFMCYLAAPRSILDHYGGYSLSYPMLMRFNCTWPKGHREPRNKVGSLNPPST